MSLIRLKVTEIWLFSENPRKDDCQKFNIDMACSEMLWPKASPLDLCFVFVPEPSRLKLTTDGVGC